MTLLNDGVEQLQSSPSFSLRSAFSASCLAVYRKVVDSVQSFHYNNLVGHVEEIFKGVLRRWRSVKVWWKNRNCPCVVCQQCGRNCKLIRFIPRKDPILRRPKIFKCILFVTWRILLALVVYVALVQLLDFTAGAVREFYFYMTSKRKTRHSYH